MTASTTGRDMAGAIQRALDDPGLQRALSRAMATLYERRRTAWSGGIDFEELRTGARQLKEQALARNDELLDQLEAQVTSAGGHLVRAATAAQARDHIVRLATDRGVQTIAKAKSMTSEEVHLNHALEDAGIEVVETDLGERIIQLAGERPSHLIVPAIHKTKEEIIELFARTMGIIDAPTEAEELTRLVRVDLRERFLRADMGITGANFVVADTGTLILVENEGNIRLSSQLPPIHVALVGREKLVPTLADVGTFLELLPRSATGQQLTSYVSFVTGTSSAEVIDFGRATPMRGREFHLVVLDNGRGAALADPELRETLYCIRCGACLNACAPYRNVGGHVYGADPYPGGIGCAWTYITNGHREAEDINGLCTTCSRCTEVCPVKIDIPWLNTVVKERNNREFGAGLRQQVFARADLMGDALSPVAPIATRLLRTPLYTIPAAAMGIDPTRALPAYERETLEAWFRRRTARATGSAAPAAGTPADAAPGTGTIPAAGGRQEAPTPANRPTRPRVALFVDCFVNHNLPEVGRAAVLVLERAGAEVVLAHNACCGRPAMSQGLLGHPRAWAARNLAELGRLIDQGYEVVCIEPSCLSALRDDYRRLLETTEFADDPRVARIEGHTYDFTEYVVAGIRAGTLELHPDATNEEFVVHGHCHQKSLGLASTPAEAVRLIPGAVVHEAETLCCGMVGSFGYKREYASLSRAIGRQLFDRLNAHPGQVVACGISCRSQIEQGTGRAVRHPAEVLLAALR
jgi:iron-sulfur cluster protein